MAGLMKSVQVNAMLNQVGRGNIMADSEDLWKIAREENQKRIAEGKNDEITSQAAEVTSMLVGPVAQAMAMSRLVDDKVGRYFSASIIASVLLTSCKTTDEVFLTLEEAKTIVIRQENKLNKK